MFKNSKHTILAISIIFILQQINGALCQITTTSTTTTGPYQTPTSTYSACGPFNFGLIMAIMFIVLIIFHSLIVSAVIKRFLQSKKERMPYS